MVVVVQNYGSTNTKHYFHGAEGLNSTEDRSDDILFVLKDHLGSTRALIDETIGTEMGNGYGVGMTILKPGESVKSLQAT